MKVVFGCDHGGFQLKQALMAFLKKRADVTLDDVGSFLSDPADYPDAGIPVAEKVIEGKADRGVLICKTGVGMSMVANRFCGVRAALCTNLDTVQKTRSHNDANVLSMPGDIPVALACEMLMANINTTIDIYNLYLRHVNKISIGD